MLLPCLYSYLCIVHSYHICIAISEAHNRSEADWVCQWLHTGHLHIEGRKMSKSLKNFISIDEYLQSGLTSSPADDFRIFCLQFKYNTSLTYSPDRIRDAQTFRHKVSQLLSVIETKFSSRSTYNKSLIEDLKRPTNESKDLEKYFQYIKVSIHHHLLNDFDTPSVLSCLSDLISKSYQYLNIIESQQNHPMEPLVAIYTYISKILFTFGLQFVEEKLVFNYNSNNINQLNVKKGEISDEFINLIVNFRSKIRQQTIDSLKNKTTNINESNNSSLKSIMLLCDSLRNDLNSQFNIKIDDLAGNISKWIKK